MNDPHSAHSGASADAATNGSFSCASSSVGRNVGVSPASVTAYSGPRNFAASGIHDRLRVRHLLVPRPPTRLEPDVTNLVHQELQRHAVLQIKAHRRGEAVHQPRD